jgi:hypothetical protein
MAVDMDHFDKKDYGTDPDRHQNEKSDSDPHQSERRDRGVSVGTGTT